MRIHIFHAVGLFIEAVAVVEPIDSERSFFAMEFPWFP